MAVALGEDALLDWQQQVDEVQALGAIFEEDFRVLEASGVLPGTGSSGSAGNGAAGSAAGGEAGAANGSAAQHPLTAADLAELDAPASPLWVLDCSLLVQMAPPAGSLQLQLAEEEGDAGRAASPGGRSGSEGHAAEAEAAGPAQSSSSGGRGAGYCMQYLPPICMQLQLAAGYPSCRPPVVSLSALWLTRAAAAQLEAALQQVWAEQGPGAPVCYSWADWLASSALQHLGMAERLVVGGGAPSSSRGDEEAGEEAGAVGGQQGGSGASSSSSQGDAQQQRAEQTLVMLLRYNALQEHAAFQAATHACGVCMEELPGSQFVRLEPCRHAWCRGCLGEQARIHVAEGGLDALRCPDPRCKAPLAPDVLRRVLPAEDFARWEQLTLQRTLDTMPDAAYCPRCSTVSIEDSDSCAQCPKCFFVFCSLCMEAWHPGVACVSAETKLAMLRRKMEGGGRAALEALRRQEQELLSVAQIEKISKRCPRCGMATQKAEGCNKMSCGGCGAFWCWRCGKEIDGYKHFRSGDCILFDEAEILRWEAQWEEMQAAARVMAAGMRNEMVGETAARREGRARGCSCPQCGQFNNKIGKNNHMTCWSCTSSFCYSCRAVLRGKGAGGSHYGPRGCKQHSAD